MCLGGATSHHQMNQANDAQRHHLTSTVANLTSTEADQHQYVIPRLNWQAANPTPYIPYPCMVSLCPHMGMTMVLLHLLNWEFTVLGCSNLLKNRTTL